MTSRTCRWCYWVCSIIKLTNLCAVTKHACYLWTVYQLGSCWSFNCWRALDTCCYSLQHLQHELQLSWSLGNMGQWHGAPCFEIKCLRGDYGVECKREVKLPCKLVTAIDAREVKTKQDYSLSGNNVHLDVNHGWDIHVKSRTTLHSLIAILRYIETFKNKKGVQSYIANFLHMIRRGHNLAKTDV